eukprot:TRINITY_DN36348_c0_g1_i1.p1 TRINITY_DN36348_c0_g1~~TRINITY_DN36348_c0_g1_i1.p1  ORF type:complete len:176 (-),score=31.29 TRINITY_DN36348_c0_g1_i1:8-535(-)
MDHDAKSVRASPDSLLERATALTEAALQCAKDGAQAANRIHDGGDDKTGIVAELSQHITRGRQAIKDAQELIFTRIPALQTLEGGTVDNNYLAPLQRRVLDAESQLLPLKRLRQKLLHEQVERQSLALQDSINRMKAKHAPDKAKHEPVGNGQHKPESRSRTGTVVTAKPDATDD